MSAVFSKHLRGNFNRVESAAISGKVTEPWVGGSFYWGKQMAGGTGRHSGGAGRNRPYYILMAKLGANRRALELRLKAA